MLIFKQIFVSSVLLTMFVAAPTQAAVSDSERLQNTVDNFEVNMGTVVDDLDAVMSLTLDEDQEYDNENYSLAELKYAEAGPILDQTIVYIDNLKLVTQYLVGVSKEDKKAIKVSLQEMIVQIAVYKQDLDDGFERAGEEDGASEGLGQVEDAISEAKDYISSNTTQPHDTIESYMKAYTFMMKEQYKDSLDYALDAYDNYKDILGKSAVSVFLDRLNTASSRYSDGAAFYNKAIEADEERDLQLLNRSAKKMLQARKWLAKTFNTMNELEESL